MEINNLKQVKDILSKIPDKYLETLSFGLGEGREETIGILSTGLLEENEDDWYKVFDEIKKVCPEFDDLEPYFTNIGKAQAILDGTDEMSEELSDRLYSNGEVITNVFFDKKEGDENPSSSSWCKNRHKNVQERENDG